MARLKCPRGRGGGGERGSLHRGHGKPRHPEGDGRDGVITTVAGNGSPECVRQRGPATDARLNSPRGIQVAANGDLYIGDRSNNLIRKVTAITGTISSYAGTGAAGYSGDGGAATLARLRLPQGLHLRRRAISTSPTRGTTSSGRSARSA